MEIKGVLGSPGKHEPQKYVRKYLFIKDLPSLQPFGGNLEKMPQKYRSFPPTAWN